MGRIFFFSRDPGGANLLKEVYRELFDYPLIYFAKDFSEKVLESANISFQPVGNKKVPELLQGFNPDIGDLFLTGTSNIDDTFEKEVWGFASENDIPLCIFLDQPFRLGSRFCIDGKVVEASPEYMFAPSEKCEGKIREYFPDVKVKAIGYPQIKTEKSLVTDKYKLVEKRVGVKLDHFKPNVFFISEPENMNENPLYDETDLFDQLVDLLGEEYNLILKLHPKDSKSVEYPFVVRNELTSSEVMDCADHLIGIKSILLLEGLKKGRSISILDFLNSDDEKMYTEMLGEENLVHSFEEIKDNLKMDKSGLKPKVLSLEENWENRVLEVVKKILSKE